MHGLAHPHLCTTVCTLTNSSHKSLHAHSSSYFSPAAPTCTPHHLMSPQGSTHPHVHHARSLGPLSVLCLHVHPLCVAAVHVVAASCALLLHCSHHELPAVCHVKHWVCTERVIAVLCLLLLHARSTSSTICVIVGRLQVGVCEGCKIALLAYRHT